MQVALGKQQAGQPLVKGRLRHKAADQVGSALVHGALQPAVLVALEPAVGRIRRAGPSRFSRNAGLPPVSWSSCWRLGVPRSNHSIRQPLPEIHSLSGCAAT